jgi:hypothetical protein
MDNTAIDDIINEVFPEIKKNTQGSNDISSEVTQSNPEYVAQYVAFLQHILNRAKQENNYDLLDELVRLLGPSISSEDAIDTDNQPNNILDAITELLQTRKLEDVTAPSIGHDGLLDETENLLGSRSAVEPSAPKASGDILQAIDDLLQLSDTSKVEEAAEEPTTEPTKGILESIDELLQPSPGPSTGPGGPSTGPSTGPASGPGGPPTPASASTSCNDANVCIEKIDNGEPATNVTTYNIVGEGKEAKIVKEIKDAQTSTDQTVKRAQTSP